jgi:methyl-coenzyme M reductase subunit D
MVAESDTQPVQVEIFPSRFLMPETAQKLLTEIHENGGILRITIHGPSLPRTVPYGPGKGTPIEENRDLLVEVGGEAFELKVKLGRVRLELESEKYLEGLKAACERALPPNISVQVKKGRFFRESPTVSDYAKYGPVKEKDRKMLGMIDPKAKRDRLSMLSDKNAAIDKEER